MTNRNERLKLVAAEKRALGFPPVSPSKYAYYDQTEVALKSMERIKEIAKDLMAEKKRLRSAVRQLVKMKVE